ncbi:MAG: phosphodiester glycosidase family protein [Synechococcales bacterium]|nr:phosphodiester glycosidase family protein [Synechococcales bacterium]
MRVLTGALLGLVTACFAQPQPDRRSDRSVDPSAPSTPIAPLPLQYQKQEFPKAIAHILRIPQNYTVSVGVATDLTTVDRFVQKKGAIAGLNAGFFDPINGLSTSYITVLGKQVADPQQNDRLIQNPDLQPYLQQIWNRSEFRRYHCQNSSDQQKSNQKSDRFVYSINYHQDPVPSHCRVMDAVGAGPQLLPQLTAEREGFWDAERGRDAIGLHQPNARSAIGLTAQGEVILVMVEQSQPGGGMTLPQVAQLMQQLGALQALNLDGGTSSALYRVAGAEKFLHWGKRDAQGEAIGRPVKSVILVFNKS